MKICFDSEVEQLDNELNTLLASSQDPKFTTFLYQLKGELAYAPEHVQDIRGRAIANYDMYVSAMRFRGIQVEPLYFKAIYNGAEVEVLYKKTEDVKEEKTEEKIEEKTEEVKAEEKEPEQPEPEESVIEESPVVEQTAIQEDNGFDSFNNFPQNTAPEAFAQNPAPEPAPMPAYNTPVYNNPVYTAPVYPSQNLSKKTEYAVGAVVMSVIGAVFLLTGLVYFAVNFLDTFAQGMLMYLMCIAVLTVSELLIRRIIPKLSSVFSAIGISGLFLSTVVNYRALENISLPVAGVILALCAVLVCLFGYYRKSRLYSAIGFFAGFASSVAIGSDVNLVQYMVITLGTLLISCLWMIFPAGKQYKLVDTFMIIAEVIYLFVGIGYRIDADSAMAGNLAKLIFGLMSWFVCQFVYYHSEKSGDNYNNVTDISIVNMIIMIMASVIYSLILAGANSGGLEPAGRILVGIIAYIGMTLPAIIFTCILKKKKVAAWKIFYVLFTICGVIVIFYTQSTVVVSLVLAFHIVTGKLVVRAYPNLTCIKVIDVIAEIFIAFILTFSSVFFAPSQDESLFALYFCAFVLGTAMIAGMFIASSTYTSSWYPVLTQLATIISVTSAVSTVFIPEKLSIVSAMGLILLFTFLVNTLSSLRTTDSVFVNYTTLIAQFVLLHVLAAQNYSDGGYFGVYVLNSENLLIFAIGVIFALAFLILTLRKEYGIFYAEKYMTLPIFMTWICFLAPVSKNFLFSIILMAIAVLSVIIGFVLKRKGIRVYGLVLSIIVCAKIAFIDFVTLSDVKSKTIMYIIVGAFALLIGTIYMALESKENKAAKKNEQGAS